MDLNLIADKATYVVAARKAFDESLAEFTSVNPWFADPKVVEREVLQDWHRRRQNHTSAADNKLIDARNELSTVIFNELQDLLVSLKVKGEDIDEILSNDPY